MRTVVLFFSLLFLLTPASSPAVPNRQYEFCDIEYQSGGCSGNCCYSFTQYYCGSANPAQYCDCNSTVCDDGSQYFYIVQCNCY